MKKKCAALLIILNGMALLLGGCGNSIPDMTEEQIEEVGEYAAITLLRYDATNRSRLVDLSTIIEEEPKVNTLPEQPQSTMRPVADTPIVEMGNESIAEFLELAEGMDITYQNNEICQSYLGNEETDNYFTLDATEGKVLLVLHFSISNQTGVDQKIDLLEKNVVYQATLNGSYTRTALTTMLMNDMSTYIEEIPAGQENDIVLLFEVDQEAANQLTSISVNLKNDGKIQTIQLM